MGWVAGLQQFLGDGHAELQLRAGAPAEIARQRLEDDVTGGTLSNRADLSLLDTRVARQTRIHFIEPHFAEKAAAGCGWILRVAARHLEETRSF